MTIIRATRPEGRFTVIDNAVLRDTRLSMRALGLLVRLLSRPDDWRTNSEVLAREFECGRDVMRSTLRELADAGYMRMRKTQDEKGRWASAWMVFDTPEAVEPPAAGAPGDLVDGAEMAPTPEKPDVGSPTPGKPYVGGSGAIQKTDLQKTDTNTPPNPPAGGRSGGHEDEGSSSPLVGLARALEMAREAGEDFLPQTHPVFDYAGKVGIGRELLLLHWREFKRRRGGAGKRQRGLRGWRQAFMRSVEDNWYGLWFLRAGEPAQLTTRGVQAENFWAAKDAEAGEAAQAAGGAGGSDHNDGEGADGRA